MGVCIDTPLRIAFAVPPVTNSQGKVQLWMVGSPDVLVHTLDLSVARFTTRVGGVIKNYWPFFTDGNVMSIVLPSGVLTTAPPTT